MYNNNNNYCVKYHQWDVEIYFKRKKKNNYQRFQLLHRKKLTHRLHVVKRHVVATRNRTLSAHMHHMTEPILGICVISTSFSF